MTQSIWILATLGLAVAGCGVAASDDPADERATDGTPPLVAPTGTAAGDPEGNLVFTSDDKLPPPTAGPPGASADCGRVLQVRVRDFLPEHPDFESFGGAGVTKGLVEPRLGPDRTPVYAHPGSTAVTTGPEAFYQWYHDVENVNYWIDIEIEFTEPSPGRFVYDNSAFFPIDGQAFGNGPVSILDSLIGAAAAHNFLFTTEIHTEFTYSGGEVFTFTGDDDLWVFVNDRLALDLGGLHSASTDTLDMDLMAAELEVREGETYPMDIFHAERHTSESNYRIETTIRCFTPVEIIR